MTTHRPRRFLLQWHITERCNRHCSHCYQEGQEGAELSFQEWLSVVQQFTDLLGFWNRQGKTPVRGHLTLSGGEPFLRPDFPDLLQVLAAQKNDFSFAILTNGSLINEAAARRLRQLGPTFVQLSLEGDRAINDAIRGPGSFEQTAAAAKHLRRAGVPTLISFTAQRANYRHFADVAMVSRRWRVNRLWADRFVPLGDSGGEVLGPEETKEFFEIMWRARRQAQASWRRRKTTISMRRALQFLVGGGIPYRCTAGDALLALLPNGDLVPCRRMPMAVGKVLQKPLTELYYDSEILQDLRTPRRIAAGCQGCHFAHLCRGGLKCLSYALHGDPWQRDPGCWLLASEA